MIDSSNFKKGDCIVFKNAPMTIVDVSFSTPTARGSGVIVKTKLKNLLTGQLLTESLRTGERYPEVDLELHPCSYMYSDGQAWHFMDGQSYEQFSFGAAELGDAVHYLVDGVEDLRVTLIDGRPVGIALPHTVALLVVECDPAVRGGTATAVTKTAKLETGLVLQVPSYLASGEKIRVDTRDGHFVSRA
jgi:elongation factor P